MGMIEKIDELIKQKRLSQAALERTACLSENRISKWKDGTGEPTARQALRIARILKVPVEFLIDDEMEAPPPVRELSPAEERAIEMVRALDLDVQDVIRGLSAVALKSSDRNVPIPHAIGGHPVEPAASSRPKGNRSA